MVDWETGCTGRNPEDCRSVGLDCRDCVEQAAVSIAQACHALPIESARELFHLIFDQPVCRCMLPCFEWAFLEATGAARLSTSQAAA